MHSNYTWKNISHSKFRKLKQKILFFFLLRAPATSPRNDFRVCLSVCLSGTFLNFKSLFHHGFFRVILHQFALFCISFFWIFGTEVLNFWSLKSLNIWNFLNFWIIFNNVWIFFKANLEFLEFLCLKVEAILGFLEFLEQCEQSCVFHLETCLIMFGYFSKQIWNF